MKIEDSKAAAEALTAAMRTDSRFQYVRLEPGRTDDDGLIFPSTIDCQFAGADIAIDIYFPFPEEDEDEESSAQT